MRAKLVIAVILLALMSVFACSAPSTTPRSTATPTGPSAATPSPTQALAIWSADGVISPGEYSNTDTYGNYEIHWKSDGRNIYVAMRAKTNGWFAVAFGPESRMKNADMVFGYVEDGVTNILDTFSTGDLGPHPPDVQQGGSDDILEYGGTEDGGYTTIEFKRALDTGDNYDKPLAPGKNRILWSYGSGDSVTQKHTKRGYGEILLQ